MSNIAWIGADWGTTHLRIWGLDHDNNIVARRLSSDGMNSLTTNQFEPALIKLIDDILPDGQRTLILAAGMVGAKQGWKEAAYVDVPWTPSEITTEVTTNDPRLNVHILPGVCQRDPADVMRGEETQVRGFLSTHPGWTGIICLPGTHSKWLQIASGSLVRFQTFMTGELYDVLKRHTVLKHSVLNLDEFGPDFDASVAEIIENDQDIVSRLFSIRAEGLLNDLTKEQATARLSGLIIGAEIKAARSYLVHSDQVRLLAPEVLGSLYGRALVECPQHLLPTAIAQNRQYTAKFG